MTNDHSNFSDLYTSEYDDLVLWIGFKFGHDVAESLGEDAVQFAFMQLAAGLMPADHPAPVAWLRIVAYNQAILLLNQETKRGALTLDAPAPIDDGLDLAMIDLIPATGSDLDLRVMVREHLDLIARLKTAEARVLLLRVAGWRYKDIATYLGVSYTWVNRYLVEGREHLRHLIEGGE